MTIKATPHPPDSSTHGCSRHGTRLLTSPGEAKSLYSNIILSWDETCPPLFAWFLCSCRWVPHLSQAQTCPLFSCAAAPGYFTC